MPVVGGMGWGHILLRVGWVSGVGAGGGWDGVGTHIATCALGVRCRVPVVGGNIHTGVCV